MWKNSHNIFSTVKFQLLQCGGVPKAYSRVQNTEDALNEVQKWVHLIAISWKISVVGGEEGTGSQCVLGRITSSDGDSEKKCFGKYPESKIILHHNDKFRKLGEPFKYLSDDTSFLLNKLLYMELMHQFIAIHVFRIGWQRWGGLSHVLDCISMNG